VHFDTANDWNRDAVSIIGADIVARLLQRAETSGALMDINHAPTARHEVIGCLCVKVHSVS
jgi:hypothetical protein